MNRTDRLLAMVMLLQSRRVITAAQLAEHFGITERTVYRDLVALGEAGVPVLGEPGLGYSLMRGYHLPPVMFSADEAFALVTGGLLTERMTDVSMRDATRSAIGKVTAVLPANLQDRIERLRKAMLVRSRLPSKGTVPLNGVQMAVAEGRVLHLHYLGAARGEATHRSVEPLGLVFYLDHWHLIAWCRLRNDVRDFRIDRIVQCEVLVEMPSPRPDFNLSDYLKRYMVPDHGQTAVIEIHEKLMESLRRYWGPALVDEQSLDKRVRVRLAYGGSDMEFFARWLLGMGSQVKIIEPVALRKRVALLAQETMEHHRSKKNTAG